MHFMLNTRAITITSSLSVDFFKTASESDVLSITPIVGLNKKRGFVKFASYQARIVAADVNVL